MNTATYHSSYGLAIPHVRVTHAGYIDTLCIATPRAMCSFPRTNAACTPAAGRSQSYSVTCETPPQTQTPQIKLCQAQRDIPLASSEEQPVTQEHECRENMSGIELPEHFVAY